MNEAFNIYIDRLRHGNTYQIDESVPVDFLDVDEEMLLFNRELKIQGEAYLSEETLVLHFDAEVEALIPCSICNEKVKVPVIVKGAYWTIELSQILGGVYSFQDVLRETVLLEVPSLAECQGKCPHREELGKYLKKENEIQEGYHPFANLDLE